jgi:hypothetical protein
MLQKALLVHGRTIRTGPLEPWTMRGKPKARLSGWLFPGSFFVANDKEGTRPSYVVAGEILLALLIQC